MDFEKRCREIVQALDRVEKQMADPEVAADQVRYREAAKAHSDLSRQASKWHEVEEARRQRDEAETLLHDPDPDMVEMARAEFEEQEKNLEKLENELQLLLLPKDPHDEKDIVMEIRAGTGRRGGGALRGRPVSHVYALCRTHGVEDRYVVEQPDGTGRLQRSDF